MDAATTTRSTQTATTPDGVIHIFTVSNGRTRCPETDGLVRTGRKPLSDITCPACGEQYPTARPRPVTDLSSAAQVALKRSSGHVGAEVRSIIAGVMDELRAARLVGPRGHLTAAGARKHDELLPPVTR